MDAIGRLTQTYHHVYLSISGRDDVRDMACDCKTPPPCSHLIFARQYMLSLAPVFPSPSLCPATALLSDDGRRECWSVESDGARRRACVTVRDGVWRCQVHGVDGCDHVRKAKAANIARNQQQNAHEQSPNTDDGHMADGENNGTTDFDEGFQPVDFLEHPETGPSVVLDFPETDTSVAFAKRPPCPAWLHFDARVDTSEKVSHCGTCARRLSQRTLTDVVRYSKANAFQLHGNTQVAWCEHCKYSIDESGMLIGTDRMLLRVELFGEFLSLLISTGATFTGYTSHQERMFHADKITWKFPHRETFIKLFNQYVR